MEFEGRKRIRTYLNIAPLIDIVFLLIIFLMLSSHFVAQPGIKITLPAAVTAKLHPEEEILIFITGDNSLYLNGKAIVLGDLLNKLKEKLETAEKKVVIIKADKKINLGLAVEVMDIAKQAGVEGLVISTITPPGCK